MITAYIFKKKKIICQCSMLLSFHTTAALTSRVKTSALSPMRTNVLLHTNFCFSCHHEHERLHKQNDMDKTEMPIYGTRQVHAVQFF